jgi:hypothetical protein
LLNDYEIILEEEKIEDDLDTLDELLDIEEENEEDIEKDDENLDIDELLNDDEVTPEEENEKEIEDDLDTLFDSISEEQMLLAIDDNPKEDTEDSNELSNVKVVEDNLAEDMIKQTIGNALSGGGLKDLLDGLEVDITLKFRKSN